jgi:hypothetical protein
MGMPGQEVCACVANNPVTVPWFSTLPRILKRPARTHAPFCKPLRKNDSFQDI